MNRWIAQWYETHEEDVGALMHDLWRHPEPGMKEHACARITGDFMKGQGFRVSCIDAMHPNEETDKPNTVIAVFGSGKPVVGILGELDALPGLGQEAVPFRSPADGPGHGCGHNLISGGAAGAAAALKYAMEKEGLSGTVKLVQCPAEEIGTGKVYLAKAGIFDDMDICMMWHPYQMALQFQPFSARAFYSLLFEFFGKPAHAAGAPWEGRSALDAVLLMNTAAEYYREHKFMGSDIHYCIVNGGSAPNIVPDYASSKYFLRAAGGDIEEMKSRVEKMAEGAAKMTETRFQATVLSANHEYVNNTALCRRLYKASQRVPGLEYTAEEYEFAKKLYESVTEKEAPADSEALLPVGVRPYSDEIWPIGSCSDVSEPSRICPTIHVWGTGRCVGLPSHHWNVTALAGSSVGRKAAIHAYRIIAEAGYDALTDPGFAEECWKEFRSYQLPPYQCKM